MRDRVIELVRLPASQLVEHPSNPSIHSDQQRAIVGRLMHDVGMVDVLKGRRLPDGRVQIFDGHLRRDIAGDEVVPVIITDLDESEFNAVTAQFDWTTTLKTFDTSRLEELIESIPQDVGEMFAGIFEQQVGALDLWASATMSEAESGEVAEQFDDSTPPAEPETQAGDIWQLGEHRLLCGDSTKDEDVAKLMGKKKAGCVFTDPPYSVNIQGGAQNKTIAGDITSTAITFAFEVAIRIATTEDARLYFCGSQGNVGLYGKLFERYCRQTPRLLVWVKENFCLKANGYHNQYEFIFHGFKPKGGGLNKWFAGRTMAEASDVWKIGRDPSKSYEHVTQKPVALAQRAIANSCEPGGIVLDMFGGSGSTLIAADQLGRACCMMEIDPAYCDVIKNRWERFSGKKAKRK